MGTKISKNGDALVSHWSQQQLEWLWESQEEEGR